jgi:peptidoglycan/xylan/chitin deacetylase (PgdA/CDA1 family)
MLSYAIHVTALSTGFSVRQARRQPGSRILMFHAVGAPDQPVLELPTMRVYSVSTIERHLEYLRRHFSVVDLATLVAHVASGEKRPPGELAITFDDGLRCHALWIYPVLQRLGLSATFFVCPALTESGTWQWSYDIQLRLLTLPNVECRGLLRELGAPTEGLAAALYWMSALPLRRRIDIEGAVRDRTPTFRATVQQEDLFGPMNWAEMRGLDPKVVTIGSHSMSHPSLPTLDPAMLDNEVAGSRVLLEQRLQRPVEAFCYPDGQTSPPVVEAVRASYLAGVTTRSGLVLPGSDPHLLPRFGAGEEPLATEVWRLHRVGGLS